VAHKQTSQEGHEAVLSVDKIPII